MPEPNYYSACSSRSESRVASTDGHSKNPGHRLPKGYYGFYASMAWLLSPYSDGSSDFIGQWSRNYLSKRTTVTRRVVLLSYCSSPGPQQLHREAGKFRAK